MNKCYRILHLDDNPIFTNSIDYLFADMDIYYHQVKNVAEATEFLSTAYQKGELPNLFICDLMLENDWDSTTGEKFIKEIYDLYHNDLKIMVLSSRCDREIIKELDHYIDCYQVKMFDEEEFRETINNLLN